MSDAPQVADGAPWPKKRHTQQPCSTPEQMSTNIEPPAKQLTNPEQEVQNTAKHDRDYKQTAAATETRAEGENGTQKSAACWTLRYPCYIPKRLIVTMLLGAGMLLVYSMRTNVGVTVVMILDERAYSKVGTVGAYRNIPRVNWNSRMVGFLHSIFYIGFIVSQIPGALFTTILPSHKLYGGCILTSAVLNIFLPLCIDQGVYALVCVVRCCQGLSEGLLYPACYGVLRHWSSPRERSRQVASVVSCGYAGAILGFPLAGLITHYLGWQYIFYVSARDGHIPQIIQVAAAEARGVKAFSVNVPMRKPISKTASCCMLWYLLWLCLSYEKPSHHKSMSDSEFEFLEKAQGIDAIDFENERVPWKEILTSLPVIAICLCHFVRHWVFSLMLTNEPLYLNEFGYNIATTGALASLPHVAKVCLSFASGCIADALLNRKLLSTTAVRKLLVGIGLGIQTAGFIVLTFLRDGTSVIIVLTVTIGAFGLTTSGWSVNHYDLSTRYASSLVAVTSTVGTVGAIIVPLVTGVFTVAQTIESWDNVFYLTASIVGVAATFYLIFGSGEQQHWSNPPAHLCLVQKTDPLARKPYSTFAVQKGVSLVGLQPLQNNKNQNVNNKDKDKQETNNCETVDKSVNEMSTAQEPLTFKDTDNIIGESEI